MASPRSPMSTSWSSSGSASSEDLGSSPRVRESAAVKLIDLKVSAEEKMTKASARLSEKVVLVRLNLAFGLRRIIRHEQSPRHDKCLNYVAETQTAATERRVRKEREASERAEWARAVAREWSAYKSSRHMEHHKPSSSHDRLHKESMSHQQLLQGAA